MRKVLQCAAAASCGIGLGLENVKAATQTPVHLRIDDTIGDVLQHHAFAGFGHLLLPREERRYETTMRLREIGSLLPYHTRRGCQGDRVIAQPIDR